MDAIEALTGAGGAARWAELARAGVGRASLRRARERGLVARLAPSLYALPGAHAAQVARAALGGDRAAFSCGDAARELGLTVLCPDERTHLVTGRGTTATWPGTVVHRTGLHRGGRRMDPVLVLLTASRCLDLVAVVSLVDQALSRGLVSERSLVATGSRTDAAWRTAVRLADRRSGSAMESFARVPLVRAFTRLGLRVETQVVLTGVGRVDLLVDGWLVVEPDGFAYHADRASYRRDRRRDSELSRHGYVWLRVTYEDVVGAPERMVATVLETYDRGRPPCWTDVRRR